jgi:3-deoxy-D-manno-octulosonic-acid transferase
VIFVKYEFWNNYISELDKRKIPLYLISGIFRKEQHFFSWYGSFFRKMLSRFTWFYVQDENSAVLLKGIGLNNVTVAGDTRFDRVVEITKSAKDIPVIEKFRSGEKLFLAGSSWKPDEEIIAAYINKYPGKMKWIFAPHEIGPENIDRLQALFSVGSARYSEFKESDSGARVLIIDNIGMLSSAYRYASIAEVGGGFGKGIHNILEPACWGIPVLFGPKYRKFREAVELREAGGADTFEDYAGFEKILNSWLSDEEVYRKAAEISGKYVAEHTGATGKILTGIG